MEFLKNNFQTRRFLVYLSILIFIFVNFFLPSVTYKYNIISPSLNEENPDFHAYYSGGLAYSHGLDPFSGTRYVYPPTFLPAYSLLTRMDYDHARAVWVWIYSVIFLLSLTLAIYWIDAKYRINLAFAALLIVFVSFPFAYHVQQGQMDLIVAALSYSSLILYLRKNKNISAACLAAATLVKVTPIFFLVTFVLFFRDWKYLARFTIALAGMILLSGLFFPLSTYWHYLVDVLPKSTGGIRHPYNQTLLRYFAGMQIIPQVITFLGLGGITLLGLIFGKKYQGVLKQAQSPGRNWQRDLLGSAFFFANGLTILLVAGKAWIMAYVWFILPLAVLIIYALEYGRTWWFTCILFGAVSLHALVGSGKISSAINMIGGLITLICILIMFIFPGLTLEKGNRLTDTNTGNI